MNINSIGVSSPQKSVVGSSKDIEQKIKTLEEEKVKLEQAKQKEDNPFATKQSENCDSIDKKIKQLDKQIQQLKAEASTSSTSSTVQKNEDQNKSIISTARQFDEFVHSEDQPKQSFSGVYNVSSDENGNPVISFDQTQAEKNYPKENVLDDISLLKKSSDKVKEPEEDKDKTYKDI